MHYRVVIQGRTLAGADVGEVKQQFVRVTGLPARVAEQLFGGMPKVIKRQVSQSDAERIAATLRAIGAAATVERELPGGEEDAQEGIRFASPLNSGPPTIIPGMGGAAGAPAAPSRMSRALAPLRDNWKTLAGGVAMVCVAVLLAPYALDLTASLRRGEAPAPAAPVKRAAASDAAAATAADEFIAENLHGPWRCVDQRTGTSAFWTFGDGGSLVYHGEVLSDRPAPPGPEAAPNTWRLDGPRLTLTGGARALSYNVTELSLTRLRYGDTKGLDIRCRRP